MVMKALRDAASGGLGKFILFGFLVLAAGGLVLTDVGGFFRGGVTQTDVARIGKESIKISDFDRDLRQTLRRIGISPEDAYKRGYTKEVLNGQIRSWLTYKTANDTGLILSRAYIADYIRKLIKPMVQDGQNAQDVLNQLLMAQGMSEAQLIQSLNRDIAGNILTDSIAEGFSVPSPFLSEDLMAFRDEERSIEYIEFLEKDVKDIPLPSDEQLRQLYTSTQEIYAIPETRIFKLIKIKSDNLKEKIDISNEELQEAYDSNIDTYSIPEKRTIEQAILESKDAAQKTVEAFKENPNLKEAVKLTTSKTTAYLEPQPFEKSGLIEPLQAPVYEAHEKDILGPIESPLGWHVIHLTKIKDAHIVPFEEAKKDIKNELLESKVIDQHYEMANTVDDMLAAGNTLDEVAQDVDIEIKTLPAMNGYGQAPDGKDALKDYEEDRTEFLETGFNLEEGETSAVFETNNSSFVALHLETLNLKSYTPFEEVKDALQKRWVSDQRRSENKLNTLKTLANIESGAVTFKDIAKDAQKTVEKRPTLKRGKNPGAPLTAEALADIYEAPPQKPFVIDIIGGTAIARVSSFKLPNETNEEERSKLNRDITKSLQSDAVALYLEGKRKLYGASVNDALLERVYGTGPEGL